ncbi:hypothetical protein PRUPE_8G066300 [Prunus persica]|uniref:Uncharacterized protein n=1 Tax=Prunus persica TaxID=3760 RepID=A0A251MU78_PRUPE|nr:uncharacterized protein LOC18767298 [Prunus persica]ONH90642.1 hypothetical protein PRUPE_8G066300 [Prunus persica]
MNMPKKDLWGTFRLRSFLQLLSGNRSSSTNASQGQFPAMGVSKVAHGYSIPQSLRLFSTNSRPCTKLDTKVLNGGEDKVQQSHQATSTRLNFGHWLKWMLGSILSLMLPFWAQNWGKLKRIEGKAEIVMEEIEDVAEVVEKVANVAEKVSADVADELPDNSKLKETVLLVERASKVAAQDAQLTQDLIHKVETLKQDLGDLETLAEPVLEKIAKRVI